MENKEITLDKLIEQGEKIKTSIKPKPSTPGVIRIGIPLYILTETEEYEKWKNIVKRFLATKFSNDFQLEELNLAIRNFEVANDYNPKNLTAIIGILHSYQYFPESILLKKQDTEKIENQINITNTQTQNQTQSQQQSVEIFIEAIKDDLTGKQVKELKEIVAEEDGNLEKAKPKILDKIKSWGGDVAAGIVTNLITNPAIWGGM